MRRDTARVDPPWGGAVTSLAGRLPLQPGAGGPSAVALGLIREIDSSLRRSQGVFEFSSREDCILRVGFERARQRLRLADGVAVEQGDLALGLHLWNEHLPRTPPEGPDLAWGARMRRRLFASLGELAAAIQADPRLGQAKAIHARLAVHGHGRGAPQAVTRIGFEALPLEAHPRLDGYVHELAEDFWLMGLAWTFNPGSLRRRGRPRRRDQLWMSSQALIARFGRQGPPAEESGGAAKLAVPNPIAMG